jgi:SAM-dependent methyltransferase
MGTRARSPQDAEAQIQLNEEGWSGGAQLAQYTGRILRPVEVTLLVRHRDALSGRVLELGCGGGRLSGYLVDIARDFDGLDISRAMVTYCRNAYPSGNFLEGNLRDLSTYTNGIFDVVFAPFNVLDVLSDVERRRVLSEIHRVLADGGLLIMSSHNLAFAPHIRKPTHVDLHRPLHVVCKLLRLPRQLRNWRRALPLQSHTADHAILVDDAHDYSLLHYYIGRDSQEAQLRSLDFQLLECLDLEGHSIESGNAAASTPELHYVARRGEPSSSQ